MLVAFVVSVVADVANPVIFDVAIDPASIVLVTVSVSPVVITVPVVAGSVMVVVPAVAVGVKTIVPEVAPGRVTLLIPVSAKLAEALLSATEVVPINSEELPRTPEGRVPVKLPAVV
jgi:hypothetical protein